MILILYNIVIYIYYNINSNIIYIHIYTYSHIHIYIMQKIQYTYLTIFTRSRCFTCLEIHSCAIRREYFTEIN